MRSNIRLKGYYNLQMFKLDYICHNAVLKYTYKLFLHCKVPHKYNLEKKIGKKEKSRLYKHFFKYIKRKNFLT